VLRRSIIRSLLFFVSCAAYAQLPVGFGVKGGWALTNAYNLSASSGKEYVVGPFADVRLAFGLGVEGDALYHPVSPTNLISSHAIWEFPVLVKYHFTLPVPMIKPLVEAGPAFRAHSGDLPNLTSTGFVIGAGVQFKLAVIRASSELRYTHWETTSTSTTSPFGDPNQVELLFGIAF
jgi:outer membrane protein with beta-barrel domain